MSSWPESKLARRIVTLMRSVPPEVWPTVREFIWARSSQQFNLLSDYVSADLSGLADETRNATLEAIISAIESGDFAMLEPANTFQPIAPADRSDH